MGTLLRVDPPGGCFDAPPLDGHRRRRAQERLGVRAGRRRHAPYYQVNPKTTTAADRDDRRHRRRSRSPRRPVSRPAGSYYVRIDNEVLQVTGGQGTTTWTVVRGQLGTAAASHAERCGRDGAGQRLVRGRSAACRPAPRT